MFINENNYSGFKLKTLADLVNFLIPFMTFGAIILFGAMLMWAAFNILTAGSDSEKIEKARGTATYSIIGLLLVVSAFLIVKLLEFILNVDLPL